MYSINSQKLKKWFLNESRDLPWRLTPTPYSIWVSEVMLQQTQVAVVIPYFEKWMKAFPTINSLAEAPLDEVIKLWEGLGYYSRARNLHQGAKFIVEHFKGQLPDNEKDLKQIKGLGPYTVGAILSFAFHQQAAAVDGNVIRVLSRLFNLHEDVSKSKTQENLRKIALSILPEKESWIQNEALIELGATICNKKPKCMQCPLKAECQAFAKGTESLLPIKTLKIKTEYLYRIVPILVFKDKLLIKKEIQGKIMSDLHEFPYFETTSESWSPSILQEELMKKWSLETQFKKSLTLVNQSFTKYQVKLNPIILYTTSPTRIEGYEWKSLEEIKTLAFSSGHRKILDKVKIQIAN